MIVIQYLQSGFFFLLGTAAVWRWLRNREHREAHLALAAGLFGAAQLILAVQASVFTEANGRIPPRGLLIGWNLVLFLSLYAFLVFLWDFVTFPRWGRVLAFAATAVNLVFAVVLRPEIVLVGGTTIVNLPVTNPIPYTVFIGYGVAFIATVFCVLAAAFGIYGLRSEGLARFRMLSIGAGFGLLLVAVGVLPVFLFGKETPVAHTVYTVVQVLGLGAAPLLYLGFTPPRFVVASRRDIEHPAA